MVGMLPCPMRLPRHCDSSSLFVLPSPRMFALNARQKTGCERRETWECMPHRFCGQDPATVHIISTHTR